MPLYIKQNNQMVKVSDGIALTDLEDKTVALDMSNGDQVVNATTGKVMSSVTIEKPSTMVASNIKNGVDIGGVVGSYSAPDYLALRISGNTPYTYANNEITTINQSAFREDHNITSFSSTSVTKIKAFAFSYCTSLTTINCSNLAYDTKSETSDAVEIFSNCTSLTSISFPLMKVAPQGMCYKCTNLASVYLPELTTTNGGQTFYMCTSLQTISLSELTTLNGSEFYGCTQLSSVSLPKIRATSTYMFTNCTSLTSISFTDAYKGAGNATNQAIGSACFQGCTNLASVSGFQYILQGTVGSYSFKDCSSLVTINLGNVTRVELYAFQNCTSLSDITLTKSDNICALLNVNSFQGVGHSVTIHVPSSLITTYQTASNWSTLYNNGDVTFVAIV